jgi:hypothetical protein
MLSIDANHESSSAAKWNPPGIQLLSYAEKWVVERVCTKKEKICLNKKVARKPGDLWEFLTS